MATSTDYLKRAEECERLAGECITDSNRKILLDVAAHWRMMAEEAARDPASCHLPIEPAASPPGRVVLAPAGDRQG